MTTIDVPTPPVPLSQAGRALHDLGLAGVFGGNLFARVALHPAVRQLDSATDRGRVVNTSWKRYGAVNGLSLAAVVAGWAGARVQEASGSKLSGRERALSLAKDGLVAATAITGVASAIEGVRFDAQSDGGAVPLEDGSTPAADAPEPAAQTKRVLNRLGELHLASTAALIAVNAALAQETFRRPPLHRRLLPS